MHSAALRRTPPHSAALWVGCLTLGFLASGNLTRADESGQPGEPFLIQSKPDRPGGPVSEVVLDEGGIELLWRVHFGFFDPVAAGNDTDGDGITDADEETNWTDPRNKNETGPKKSPEQRRQDVIEALRTTEEMLPGGPATMGEVLVREYAANAGIRSRIAMSQAAAQARVKAWLQRSGKTPEHFPGGVVVDMEGDEPVVLYENGILSNTKANIVPLWPGQVPPVLPVGSNVEGAGQVCAMWEKFFPRKTHDELKDIGLNERVFFMDFDPDNPIGISRHATAVAGIIGGTGTALHADFRGAAYKCQIHAYTNLASNHTTISALPLQTVKTMRASNHSYGPSHGWVGPNANGTKQWDGDISQNVGMAHPEDFHFGQYNQDAVNADSAAQAQPYHLLVRAAGNERKNGPLGGTYTIIIPGKTLHCVASWLGSGELREPVYVAFAAENSIPTSYWMKKDNVIPVYGNDGNGGQVIIGRTIDDPDNLNEAVLNPFPVNGYRVDSIWDPFQQDWVDEVGYFDCLAGGFTVCKNALCVGSIGLFYDPGQPQNAKPSDYSGTGPTDDGRIKPDIVAYGGEAEQDELLSLLGAAGNADYSYQDVGTSFASPAVAGAVTLLSEWQEQKRSTKEPFRASTFKALVCHTATDLGPKGPDFETGWGLINAAAAAELIKTNDNRQNVTEVFLPNSSAVASIKLRAIGTGPLGNQPSKPIKVTIAWTDPPGSIQPNELDASGSRLRHDIDLKLIKTQMPSNVTAYPWKPDPSAPLQPYFPVTPPANAPVGWLPPAWFGENHRDNVEQVYIPAPLYNEEWEIRIKSSTPLTAGTTPGNWVSVVMEGLFNPSTVADGTIIGASVATESTYVVFTTVIGGYYRLQCQPYGGPWINIDAPAGEGLIRTRSGLYTTWFGHNYGNTPVPLRIVKLSPNPFNVP